MTCEYGKHWLWRFIVVFTAVFWCVLGWFLFG